MVKGGAKGGRGNNNNSSGTRRGQADRDRSSHNNASNSNSNANETIDELLFKDICPQCELEVKSDDDGLQCDQCNQWEHAHCVGYTKEEYKLACGKHSLRYYCTNCEKLKADYRQKNQCTKDVGNDNYSSEFQELKALLSAVKDRLDMIEQSKQIDKEEINKKIEDMVEAKVKDIMEEKEEKEKRKLNLILVNIKESASPILEERKEEDIKRVQRIFKEILPTGEEPVEIREPIRFGKLNLGSRPRLLRITVKDSNTKYKILKYSQNLNKDNDAGPRMYINPDYTNKEREENKKLREELKEKRKNEPQKTFKIDRGRVVETSNQ